eukprot:TRINITY_DN10337_c0_g2_i1.p3 TRINITY_DN10337_c0_g2~~TRINITY_DN10337_c0_g2_i1.p3  ORF type:complete len:103 (-),score=25.17 TRINITY_DN10337_c0_g2_i1:101-409(-)
MCIRDRRRVHGREKGIELVSASGLEEAIKELTVDGPDRHPEKRMRKAWEDFVEARMGPLKVEFPGMKRSQYLNILQKEWKTSPENPVFKSKAASQFLSLIHI